MKFKRTAIGELLRSVSGNTTLVLSAKQARQLLSQINDYERGLINLRRSADRLTLRGDRSARRIAKARKVLRTRPAEVNDWRVEQALEALAAPRRKR